MASCSTCGAEIIWATSERGRPMPLDAKPEKRILLEQNGKATIARVVDTYVSHFVTCPQRDEHRRLRA